MQELEGDVAVQGGIDAFPDFGHTAARNRPSEAIPAAQHITYFSRQRRRTGCRRRRCGGDLRDRWRDRSTPRPGAFVAVNIVTPRAVVPDDAPLPFVTDAERLGRSGR